MKHIVSFSGGKDSTAMLLRMLELNMPIDRIIFADTTLEYPENYKFIKKVEKYIGRKIERVYPETSFYQWFYGKVTRGRNEGKMRGMPLALYGGYCCRELKIKPQQKLKSNPDDIYYLGYANDEKHRILKGDNFRYPLIEWGWSEQKCMEYLKEKGMVNPLYLDGWNRIGCWLCPKQSKHSLRLLYEKYPKHWKCLKKLERDSPNGFNPFWKLTDLEKQFREQQKLGLRE